jgi:hypothetical protein
VIDKASQKTVREAIEAARQGESSSLEGNESMSVDAAETLATELLMDAADTHVQVYRRGPWLIVEPLRTMGSGQEMATKGAHGTWVISTRRGFPGLSLRADAGTHRVGQRGSSATSVVLASWAYHQAATNVSVLGSAWNITVCSFDNRPVIPGLGGAPWRRHPGDAKHLPLFISRARPTVR